MNWQRSWVILFHFVWRKRAGEENICVSNYFDFTVQQSLRDH